MYTLDQFSNGDMIYAKGTVDLVEGTMSFTAYYSVTLLSKPPH